MLRFPGRRRSAAEGRPLNEDPGFAWASGFHGMSQAVLRMLEERTALRAVRWREAVYLQGDAGDTVYLVVRGIVKISSLSPDGREIILALLRQGDVFGEEGLLEEAPRDHMAEAYEGALLRVITRQDFMAVLCAHPAMTFKVMELVGFRLRTLRHRVESMLFKGAPERLAQALLDLARQHGVKDAEGVLLPFRLSQQDLASMIGVTRETVNVALAGFRSLGLVETDGRAQRVRRPAELQALT